MTAPSPLALAGALSTFTIAVDGQPIDSTYQVASITTWSAVNKVPRAELVLFDGSASEADFPIAGKATFLPGAKVKISAGYDGKNAAIFEGVIVKQGIAIDTAQGSKLILDMADAALVMTLRRNNAVFTDATDSDVIGKLIGDSGLPKDVDSTSVKHEELVQYYATDWDMMLTRAEANGLVVTVAAGKVSVKAPDTSQAPVLSVGFGDSILELSAEMNAVTQLAPSAIQSAAWDPATQAVVSSGPGSVSVTEQGNVTSAKLAGVFNVSTYPQQTAGAVEQTALQQWSSAELLRSKLSKIRGYVKFAGSALAVTGKTIDLSGLGARFNGTAFISGVSHSIADGRWTTTVTFGLSADWFAAEAPKIAAPGAAGLVPPIAGLQAGVVKAVSQDPGGEFRVQVTLPLLGAAAKPVWARLATFYASSGFGAVFYPEVGDEVVLGFMAEDPAFPVILGSVYSKGRAPKFPPDDENKKKALTTRSKLEISFDDDKKVLQIQTPGGHVLTMDDSSGEITLTDSNKNSLQLTKSGVTLSSESNLTIRAKGNVAIEAQGNLDMKAQANATLKALQITADAEGKLTANASGQAELTASALVKIQAGLVTIN